MGVINSVRELNVYKLAYQSMMEIFLLTKDFPTQEKYDLVSQIRRSSRSVVANLVESWRRRRYPKIFVLKLNDSETESDETILWLDVSKDCNYIDEETYQKLKDNYDHILSMLVKMINNPEKWQISKDKE
jgi:four helix bundle protein